MILSKLELYTIRDALLSVLEDDDGDVTVDEEVIKEALEIIEQSLINYELNKLEDRF